MKNGDKVWVDANCQVPARVITTPWHARSVQVQITRAGLGYRHGDRFWAPVGELTPREREHRAEPRKRHSQTKEQYTKHSLALFKKTFTGKAQNAIKNHFIEQFCRRLQ